MRLLIITNIPTPYRIDFFNTLSHVIQQKGDQFKVLYCSETEPNRHWEIDLSQQRFAYKVIKGFHLNLSNLFLHFNPSVVRETAKFKPDVILYAGSWNMPSLILNLLYGKLLNAKWKTVFWSEGHEGAVLHNGGIVPVIRKYILNLFDGFAVPNKRSRDYLFDHLNIPHKPVILLPNTVDGDFYTKPPYWKESDSATVKGKYNIPVSSKICIQVAQMEDRKSPRELIEFWTGMDQVKKEGCVLVLVGEGNLRKNLETYVQAQNISDVFIVGQLGKEEVRDLLFAASFFVLLTKNDPNPLTLIEASFAGLPILTTQFAGNCNEIILENRNGYVMHEISEKHFDDAFSTLRSLAATQEAGNISKQNALNNFEINQISENLMDQINSAFPEIK